MENAWEEVSRTALTDKEGRLYKEQLKPKLVSRYANFSVSFWKEGVIPFDSKEILLNKNLSIPEIEKIVGKEKVDWSFLSIKRELTPEEVAENQKIQSLTAYHRNEHVKKTFTESDWKNINKSDLRSIHSR